MIHACMHAVHGRLGIGICYDMRFAELAQSYARQVLGKGMRGVGCCTQGWVIAQYHVW